MFLETESSVSYYFSKFNIEEIVNKVKNDKDFANKFKKNPSEAVENVLGINIPNDKVDEIIQAVKLKLSNDNIKDAVKDVGDKLKDLFK